MTVNTKNSTGTNDISYQFTAVPTNLFLCLDNNCRSMLFTLIQLSSYYAKEDGYFFRTNDDLKAESNLSENVVRATLSALYNNGLIDVQTVGKGKGIIPNNFKVNVDAFAKWEEFSIEDCMKNPQYKIETADYKSKGFKASYVKNENGAMDKQLHKDDTSTITTLPASDNNPIEVKPTMQEASPNPPKSEHNINNTDYVENLENINNPNYVINAPKQNYEDSPQQNKSIDFQEYKNQEDGLMNNLYSAKTWTDFAKWRDSIIQLINECPKKAWKARTEKRFQKVKEIRMKFFSAKYAKEPYNPLYQEVYDETHCGWLENAEQVVETKQATDIKQNAETKQVAATRQLDEHSQMMLKLYNTPIEEIYNMVQRKEVSRAQLGLLLEKNLDKYERQLQGIEDEDLPF